MPVTVDQFGLPESNRYAEAEKNSREFRERMHLDTRSPQERSVAIQVETPNITPLSDETKRLFQAGEGGSIWALHEPPPELIRLHYFSDRLPEQIDKNIQRLQQTIQELKEGLNSAQRPAEKRDSQRVIDDAQALANICTLEKEILKERQLVMNRIASLMGG